MVQWLILIMCITISNHFTLANSNAKCELCFKYTELLTAELDKKQQGKIQKGHRIDNRGNFVHDSIDYSTSEIRLLEATESVCTNHKKECEIYQDYEAKIEEWYFNHQGQHVGGLTEYLCLIDLKCVKRQEESQSQEQTAQNDTFYSFLTKLLSKAKDLGLEYRWNIQLFVILTSLSYLAYSFLVYPVKISNSVRITKTNENAK